MRAITLDEAVAVINETFAEAKRRNAYPLTAVLLDAGGHVKSGDEAGRRLAARLRSGIRQAYSALAMGRQSRLVLQKAKEKPLFMQSLLDLATGPMFLEGGGQLIRDDDGEVIGALATTGDTNEVDDLCAIAGIRDAGFKTDDDFGANAPRAGSTCGTVRRSRTRGKPKASHRPGCRAAPSIRTNFRTASIPQSRSF